MLAAEREKELQEIQNLRQQTERTQAQVLKFEDWRVGLYYFEKGCYFTKFDVKSDYHHLDIFQNTSPTLVSAEHV